MRAGTWIIWRQSDNDEHGLGFRTSGINRDFLGIVYELGVGVDTAVKTKYRDFAVATIVSRLETG